MMSWSRGILGEFPRTTDPPSYINPTLTQSCNSGAVNCRLILTAAVLGTFTYASFRLPLLPTAPALAPAARASPGGLVSSGATHLHVPRELT